MRRAGIVAIFLSLFGVGASALAESHPSPVQAKLVIPDRQLLPAVPFDLWIELTNPSDGEVSVSGYATLIITTEDGKEHVLPGPPLMDSAFVALSSHERQTFAVPIARLLYVPPCLAQPRFLTPGKYTFAVRLDLYPKETLLVPVPPASYGGYVVTPAVRVERIEPTGTDGKVWELLQASGRNMAPNSWPQSVVNTILKQYPESNYVPYALLARGSSRDEAALRERLEALERFPNSPVVPYLLWEAADAATAVGRWEVHEDLMRKIRAADRPSLFKLVQGRDRAAQKD